MIILKEGLNMKLKTLKEFIAEHMKNPEFKKLWDESEEEYQKECARIRAEIEAEEKAGIVHHPTYEEAIAWMNDYKTANA